MKFKWRQIGMMAAGAILAGGGYGLGWWHHSNRNQASAGPRALVLAIQTKAGTTSPSDVPPEGNDGAPQAPDYAQIVRQILADPEKANYFNLFEPFKQWAKQDGAAAYAALLAEPRLQADDLPQALFFALGSSDPESWLALLEKSPPRPWTEAAVNSLAAGWANRVPEEAAAAGLAMPQGALRRKFLSSLATTWMRKDPVGLATWLKALPAEENLGSILGFQFLHAENVNSAEAMAAAMEVYQLAPESSRGSLVFTFTGWLKSNPKEAIPWAFQLPPGIPYRNDIVNAAANNAQDNEAALKLLRSISNGEDRLALMKGIAGAWASKDPEAAWNWASAIEDDATKSQTLASIRARVIAETPARAVAFLSERQPDQISTWGPEAAHAWAKLEPDAALAWAKGLPAGQAEDLTASVIQEITTVDGANAFSEALLVANEQTRHRLLSKAAAAFAVENVTLASARINGMAPGPDRDVAIDALIQPAFAIEPDSAMRWALAIDGPEFRRLKLNETFSRWLKSDPAAASEWLDKTPLSDELREKLHRTLTTVRGNQPAR